MGPGATLVIDWGTIVGTDLHVFCAVLAWARVRFIRFARDEKAATTFGFLAECFEELGGVTGTVLADRMGCLKAGKVANVVIPTAEYVRLATHYRFRPDFCHAADPESKGIIRRWTAPSVSRGRNRASTRGRSLAMPRAHRTRCQRSGQCYMRAGAFLLVTLGAMPSGMSVSRAQRPSSTPRAPFAMRLAVRRLPSGPGRDGGHCVRLVNDPQGESDRLASFSWLIACQG